MNGEGDDVWGDSGGDMVFMDSLIDQLMDQGMSDSVYVF
jgi:hypothetical protein